VVKPLPRQMPMNVASGPRLGAGAAPSRVRDGPARTRTRREARWPM
jgi:hypothetical protein